MLLQVLYTCSVIDFEMVVELCGELYKSTYKAHRMISCLSVSGRPFKLMHEQLQHLAQTTE